MTTHAMKAKHHTAPAGRMPLPRCPCPHLQLSRMGRTATVGTGLPGNTVSPPASTQHPYHKPHGLGQATQPGTDGCSIHFCPSSSSPLRRAAHFIGVCFSLSIISKKTSLLQQPCLYLELYFSLHLQHHHNSRPTRAGFVESQSPQQVGNGAHRLFLSMGTLSSLPQPSYRLEELSRGSSPALACLPCSRTP